MRLAILWALVSSWPAPRYMPNPATGRQAVCCAFCIVLDKPREAMTHYQCYEPSDAPSRCESIYLSTERPVLETAAGPCSIPNA